MKIGRMILGLPDNIMVAIEESVAKRIPDLQIYADCRYNDDKHVMLVAVPMALKAIEEIVLGSWATTQFIEKGWYNKWYKLEKGSSNGDMVPKHKIGRVAKHYGQQMVNFYRHPEQQEWQWIRMARNVPSKPEGIEK